MGPSNSVICSVIVPFHRNTAQLARSVRAIRSAMELSGVAMELIIVADGSPDDCSALAAEAGATLLSIPGPSGPAVARNRGAAIAAGSVLAFIDSDVVIAEDALKRVVAAFALPEISAVFGAYDDQPADPNFVSQARNLAHAFVHQRSSADASTFWAGLGAVRANAFAHVDGFDERFTQPCVEDIDLGYRMREAGFRIVLDPAIRGQHLKRWTVWSMLRTDIFQRGIPWTQLLHQYRTMRNDLNLSYTDRASVVVAYLLCACAVAALWRMPFFWSALACVAALAALDWPYYAFLTRHRGLLFTLAWFPLRVLFHLSNGMSFLIGTVLFLAGRMGMRMPGGLPIEPWQDYRMSTGR